MPPVTLDIFRATPAWANDAENAQRGIREDLLDQSSSLSRFVAVFGGSCCERAKLDGGHLASTFPASLKSDGSIRLRCIR
jgi:hypothetical protein